MDLFEIEDCDDSGAMAHVVEKAPTRGHRMRRAIDIRERIATRAYFAWQNGSTASADENWLAAEAIETALAERRAASAAKAAATRRAKAPATLPAIRDARHRAARSLERGFH